MFVGHIDSLSSLSPAGVSGAQEGAGTPFPGDQPVPSYKFVYRGNQINQLIFSVKCRNKVTNGFGKTMNEGLP